MRSGAHRGVPLEDLGVSPDETHRMTRNDLLNNNVDLLAKGGQILSKLASASISVQVAPAAAGKRKITMTTQGLDRVDIVVDGRPRATVDVVGGTTTTEIPQPGAGTHDVAARGFKGGVLRAVAHVTL
jgi:hypothetical protein